MRKCGFGFLASSDLGLMSCKFVLLIFCKLFLLWGLTLIPPV